MPKVSDAHLQARRTEIVEAAWRCFGRKGFHGTTMRDICGEAELSPGAVYGYFDGKEALIRAVAEEGRRWGRSHMLAAEAAGDPLEALLGSLKGFLTCLEDPDALPDLRIDIRLAAEALHRDDVRAILLENYRALFELFLPLIREAREGSSPASGLSPEAMARVAVALFQGLEFQKAADPDMDSEACADVAMVMLREILTGQASPGSTT